MGTIKQLDYSPKSLSISLLGRAFAHPCRVRILELIIENKKLNNQDLADYFGMTRSTIHDHLVKLWQADMICIRSEQEGTTVSMSGNQVERFILISSLFSFDTKDAFHLGVLS